MQWPWCCGVGPLVAWATWWFNPLVVGAATHHATAADRAPPLISGASWAIFVLVFKNYPPRRAKAAWVGSGVQLGPQVV